MTTAYSCIPIDGLHVTAYRIPTDGPEADGTLSWDSTTLVLVRVTAGDCEGLGYTYGHHCLTELIRDKLAAVVTGQNALAVSGLWQAMHRQLRNLGRPGLSAMAVAAVDVALWDLKARLCELPLVSLLGAVQEAVPVYGSGGFTSYTREQLQQQLAGWVQAGIGQVKMKVGSAADTDLQRVRAAREAIGPQTALMVDANGAYDRKQALLLAEGFAVYGVNWFEEPVSSDDLEGLRLLRDRAPAGMAIAAGEYGYDSLYFRRMLAAGAVDVLQADLTRCGGITGFMQAAALCQAHGIPLSAHTAPALHAHPACAVNGFRHIEYFHDHARIEQMLFDGLPGLHDGVLQPDLSRPGLGLSLREADAARYQL